VSHALEHSRRHARGRKPGGESLQAHTHGMQLLELLSAERATRNPRCGSSSTSPAAHGERRVSRIGIRPTAKDDASSSWRSH
jgi:hypothetical protein